MSDKTKPPPEPAPGIFDKNLVRAPGPGKYELSKYSDFSSTRKGANRWSFTGKQRFKSADPTPGPDKYSHPRSSFGGIKCTMAKRFQKIDRDAIEAPTLNADGKPVKVIPPAAVRSFIGSGPRFSMAGRTRQIRSDQTPDPTKYNPLVALNKVTHKVPSYSMAAKPRTIVRDPYASNVVDEKAPKPGPPPAVKSLIGSGPKYSMSGRTRNIREQPLPGPGAYPGANQDMVGKSGPRFSMSARVKKGIAYGYWGDESRLSDTTRSLPPIVVESR